MFSTFPKNLFLLLCLCALCFSDCGRKTTSARDMPDSISAFVYAYTSGEVSKTAPVRVRFTGNLAKAEQIGQAVDKGILSFRPAIEGTPVWEDERTILVKPEAPLRAGKVYLGKVDLKQLFGQVPSEVRHFEFDFQVKAQNFQVQFEGLRASDPSDSKKQTLVGTVLTNDIAEPAEVEKLLSANLSGQQPNLRWEHNAAQRQHRFYVEDILRAEDDETLTVKWNGRPMDVKKNGEREFMVPGVNNFQILDARVVQEEDQYILVYFSDPLLRAQSLEGLVRISGYEGRLRFNIDGSQLRVYPASRLNGERRVTVESSLKNSRQVRLSETSIQELRFEEPQPGLRLVGRGVVIPESDGLVFPFEAVNLHTVDVEIFKIYNNNILQFLQTNAMDGNYEMERVGKIEVQKQIRLNQLSADTDYRTGWTRYALDLSSILKQDPNAIYQVRLGFRPEYTDYFCQGGNSPSSGEDGMQVVQAAYTDAEGDVRSIWEAGYYGINGYYSGFQYQHRSDPCYPAYYNNDRFVRRNVIASNLGIIAKSAPNGTMLFYVTDLRTTRPVSGIELDVYNYQQQVIKTITTDQEGVAALDIKEPPFVVVANRGTEKGYLRLMDGNSLSLSKFDVAGAVAQKGIKGYLYGERGVWRPGDSLYLNFVLEDNSGKLPENHPINFELYDARNQLQQRYTTTTNVRNVYPLHFATDAEAPTGNWRAVVKVGGATFNKTLKVETVKPNRLKINMDFGKEVLTKSDMPMNVDLLVKWLHGAPAKELKSRVEMKLRPVNTAFKSFSEFEFDDPARTVDASYETVFDGQLNTQGLAKVKMNFGDSDQLPGKMRADYRIRAFEKGGDFSEDNFQMAYHPFSEYAGVSIPRNRYGSKRIDLEKGGTLEFAAVDQNGKAKSGRRLNVGLYRVDWSWWWEEDRSNIGVYNTSTHLNALDKQTLKTDAKGLANWDVKVNSWGRYLVRVCDEESGHCAGDFFYAGYPWWGDDSNDRHREAAAMLVFKAEKEKYAVGEDVILRIPTSAGGRALVSIETGSEVLQTYWIDTEAEETQFTFKATPEMAPTVYAHITLLQAHGQVENDLPIRMYGVIPLAVEDPATRLQPKIKMADVLQPEEKVKIEVSEDQGRPMAYTVAVVDEGLLDLTRFRTPNPWDIFYAREALGVKTWDIYDYVLGAFGGQLNALLSIGGDAAAVDKGGADKANRFKPVVQHFGPFYLEKGKTASHEFVMPNYVGSVRTMVVASHLGAYGNTEKTTPVRKPLMLLATLPRVLGPGERLKVPVNIFAMEKKVKNVTVEIREKTGLVNLLGSATQKLTFNQIGDQIAEFEIEIPERIGVARFEFIAKGGGETTTQEIEIDIRNPNPYITDIYADALESGAVWRHGFVPTGVAGTNTATLEVSSIPPLDLEKRMSYLLRYPHGCVEQTTSSVFPQLYVGEIIELNDKRQKDLAFNVKAGIDRLKRFQTNEGGMGYWPGSSNNNSWGTNYAGHFLLEAKRLGYQVSENLLDRWKDYQTKAARQWSPHSSDSYHRGNDMLTQAYRLYTLALSGSAELGAMNRLREMRNLPTTARWRLAAAYALTGKTEVAGQLVDQLTTEVEDYTELSYTYGSGIRDRAMILEALVLLKRHKQGADLARGIAEAFNQGSWYSTQSTAYCLLALGKFLGQNQPEDGLQFAYALDGTNFTNFSTKKSVGLINLEIGDTPHTVAVRNPTGGIVYARLIVNGQPMVGDETEANSHLNMEVVYKTTNGKELDPRRIPQGTDFIAEVRVRNPGTKARYYEEMALSQIFPSGWEILNTRMSNVQHFADASRPTYQDIRDDRVYSYFNVRTSNTRIYRIQLNAAYQGRFYLPSVNCEAMYDHTINARKAGKWVEVVGPEAI